MKGFWTLFRYVFGYVFGLGGRISRGAFWLRVILIWAVFAGLNVMLRDWEGAVWVLNPLTLWALVAACARRLHDRNRFSFWLIVAVIPVIGAVWLVWQLAFRKGVDFANRWGPNPKELADYQMAVKR